MNIFKAMRPAGVYPSVMDMPWDKLKGEGIDVALLDFDNTLGPDRAHEPDEYSFICIRMLQDLGIRPCLVSNAKSSRSEGIARILDIPCVTYAKKPKPDGVLDALSLMGCDKTAAVMVGDQVFTDVMAGNFAGCRSFLVEKYQKHEIWYVAIKRPFEKIVRLIAKF